MGEDEEEGRGRNRKEKRKERERKVEDREEMEKERGNVKGKGGVDMHTDHQQNHATLPHLESAEGVLGGKVHSLWLSLVAGQPLPCATVGL